MSESATVGGRVAEGDCDRRRGRGARRVHCGAGGSGTGRRCRPHRGRDRQRPAAGQPGGGVHLRAQPAVRGVDGRSRHAHDPADDAAGPARRVDAVVASRRPGEIRHGGVGLHVGARPVARRSERGGDRPVHDRVQYRWRHSADRRLPHDGGQPGGDGGDVADAPVPGSTATRRRDQSAGRPATTAAGSPGRPGEGPQRRRRPGRLDSPARRRRRSSRSPSRPFPSVAASCAR